MAYIKKFYEFLVNLPHRTGRIPVILACLMWLVALSCVFFASTEIRKVSREIMMSENIYSDMPTVVYKDIEPTLFQAMIDETKQLYPMIDINLNQSYHLVLRAENANAFTDWRAALDHFSYAKQGWFLKVKSLCAGYECPDVPLSIVLQLKEVDIKMPASG